MVAPRPALDNRRQAPSAPYLTYRVDLIHWSSLPLNAAKIFRARYCCVAHHLLRTLPTFHSLGARPFLRSLTRKRHTLPVLYLAFQPCRASFIARAHTRLRTTGRPAQPQPRRQVVCIAATGGRHSTSDAHPIKSFDDANL